MIKSFLLKPGEEVQAIEGIADFDTLFADPEVVLWIDMTNPTDEESFILTNDFHFHPIAIEDVIEEEDAITEFGRSKIDDYRDYLYLEFQIADYISFKKGIDLQEIHIFLTKNTVVTVHDTTHKVFTHLQNRALRDERLMSRGADFLLYSIVDAMVDNYNSVLKFFEKSVDDIEKAVLGQPDEETVKTIFTLRRDIYELKRVTLPQREILGQINRGQFSMISERAAFYFNDVHDHLTRIIDLSESHRDMLISALEVYFSHVSTKTNEIIKVLTIFTVILMPPTFLVGLWGMNFKFMPELDWEFGYIGFWVIIVMITAIMIGFFKKKKWL